MLASVYSLPNLIKQYIFLFMNLEKQEWMLPKEICFQIRFFEATQKCSLTDTLKMRQY